MSFQDLGLFEAVVHGAQRMGYVEPSPIQEQAIPVVMRGGDLIASAQTGTGKTAAFGLPILSRLKEAQGKVRCLILEPTRELALQVEAAFKDFSAFTDLETLVLFGGVGYGTQREALQRGVDIIVATPGRLLDFLQQGEISLADVSILVLDEVDRMLDMGFLPDVRRIVERCPKERQTLLFSATVKHAFYPVAAAQKFDLLKSMLDLTDYHSVLIFCRTKDGADRIARQLESENHKVAVMHSNRSQQERMDALEGFKSGRYEVMVATDIAARGIDIAGVSHVINFDVPQHPEDYVHRIGRTGRAQTEGELPHVKAIETFIAQKVPREKLENFPYLFTMLFQEEEAARVLKNIRGARTLKGYSYGARKKR